MELLETCSVGLWSQAQEVIESGFWNIVLSPPGANAKNMSNRIPWISFCSLLGQGKEVLKSRIPLLVELNPGANNEESLNGVLQSRRSRCAYTAVEIQESLLRFLLWHAEVKSYVV